MNSNIQKSWYRNYKKKCQIDELPKDITEILQRNTLERYIDLPDEGFKNGMHKEISNMCFSEFLSLFYPKSRTTKDLENECQPVILDDELFETHLKDCYYRKEIPVVSSK